MYLELHQHIHYYNRINQHLYLTEFGHSAPQSEKHVGPYIRSVWLLHIVLRDQCHFCDWTIGPGEGFLIAKGQVHSLTVREGYEHFWFAFDGPGVPALAALFPIGLTGHQHLRFSLPYDVLKQKLYSCFEEADGPNGERIAAAFLMSLLSCLQLAQITAPEDGYVSNARAFMKHNYYRRITMAEAAQSIGISEKHMCRIFKKETGITPIKYLIGLRMEQAKLLLQTSELRIKDIALTVGYPSQLTFSSAFSAYYGVSPTEIRKPGSKDAPGRDDQK